MEFVQEDSTYSKLGLSDSKDDGEDVIFNLTQALNAYTLAPHVQDAANILPQVHKKNEAPVQAIKKGNRVEIGGRTMLAIYQRDDSTFNNAPSFNITKGSKLGGFQKIY